MPWSIKAYYFHQSRIRNIVLNNRVSEDMQRILVAHELGHDRLHKEIAMMRGFREVEYFETAQPTEFEANIFAAELLIDDEELLDVFNDEDASFFGVARQFYVPPALLDSKLRALKHKEYRIEAPHIANGEDVDGCFEEDY